MKLKFLFLALLALIVCANDLQAKKYKFKLDHPFVVEQTGVASNGFFVKAWGIESNADKAMDMARMDAVAAALFTGIEPSAEAKGKGVAALPALVTQQQYLSHKDFFDKFFKDGIFLQFIVDVNSTYPTGENNIKTPKGRQVGINLVLHYNELKHFLQENDVLKTLNDHFIQRKK